ncbi:MAG: hypothetical protein PHU25_13155 [Deltaproteobacteria bacterium]|nr:hypothetical protein [Deltaproteobacteria bacterium]
MRLLFPWLLLLLAPAACGSGDPRRDALDRGMDLVSEIVTSSTVVDAVRNADPEMRATTAADAALRGGVVANFPRPPEGIGIQNTEQDMQSWTVVIKGDDAKKQVILEGYGDDLKKPLVTRAIDFPPR